MIYFDNAATTFPKPEAVYQALDFANRNLSFNAGRGAYPKAKEGVSILDDLRHEIASFVKADYRNVTLLSSATESLNLIILGLNLTKSSVVYVSPFEHNAIIRPLHCLQKSIGFRIEVLPFDKKTWKPDTDRINDLFALSKPTAVFISQISNVTGLIIEYEGIFESARKYGAINILDASQGYGVAPVNVVGVDFLVFAGHKSLYGPFGIAGFINFSNNELKIVKSGGNGSDTLNPDMPDNHHERYESGSPNVPAAYGLLTSIKWIKTKDLFTREKELTDYAINKLKEISKINLFVPENTDKLFGIISFSMDGYKADEIGQILSDEYEIMIRTGYHCSPLVHDFINSKYYGGTARISLSYFNTKEDIDCLVEALKSF